MNNDEMNPLRHDALLYEHVANMDTDPAYGFPLRGAEPNPLIDAATPLLGLSLRVRHLARCDDVETLYTQTQDEIKAIELELQQTSLEPSVMMAYRYILCAVLDEAVMSTPWGADSYWAEHSLLSRFHDETWGGDKVFTIVQRLLDEPERYQWLLEFVYLCLILGFEGKFKVIEHGREAREAVIVQLYESLPDSKVHHEFEPLTQATEHVVSSRYRLNALMPIWGVFAGFAGFWTVVFLFYRHLLNIKSLSVLEQLRQWLSL